MFVVCAHTALFAVMGESEANGATGVASLAHVNGVSQMSATPSSELTEETVAILDAGAQYGKVIPLIH